MLVENVYEVFQYKLYTSSIVGKNGFYILGWQDKGVVRKNFYVKGNM
jgi:hypothetical protein